MSKTDITMANICQMTAGQIFKRIQKTQNLAFADGINFALAVLTHPANTDYDQATKNLIAAELQKHTDIKLFKETK